MTYFKRAAFLLLMLAFVGSLAWSVTRVNAQTVTLFSDDFNRINNQSVGNGWTEQESSKYANVAISNQKLSFTSKDDAYQPVVQHQFAKQTSGTVEWTYDFNWQRDVTSNEGNYELAMQLGDSSVMTSPSINANAGVAVNLKWGSSSYGLQAVHDGFGYTTTTGTSQVATITNQSVVKVVANLDNHTYSLDVNPSDGVVEANNVPIPANLGIDSVRFYTNALTTSKFLSSEFDNVMITHDSGVASPPIEPPADTTAPVLSNVLVSDISADSASIGWATNEPATAQVEYGKGGCPCSQTTPLDATYTTDHQVNLNNLVPNTTYSFIVKSVDQAGNVSASQNYSFTTTGVEDTTPPVLDTVSVTDTTPSSANLNWTTDEPTTALVHYGKDACCSLQTISTTTLTTNHTVSLSGLEPATRYYYQAESKDSAGNVSLSPISSFVTASQPAGGSDVVLLTDDFNRSASSAVGNGWAELESSSSTSISNNKLLFTTNDDAYRPSISRSFPTQTSGILEWNYVFDWGHNRSEGTYELLMQLGDSTQFSTSPSNPYPGSAVNIKWAGTNNGMATQDGFGYTNGQSTTQVKVVNSQQNIRVAANLSTKTYSLDINPADGVVEAQNIPFTNNVNINTIRLTANSVNGATVNGRTFDDIEIKAINTNTPPIADTTAPIISAASTNNVGARAATINWTTNEPATSQILYSSSPCPCLSGTSMTSTPLTSHTTQLSNLQPGTLYYYQIVAKDIAGNVTTGPSASFVTSGDTTAGAVSVQGNQFYRNGVPFKLWGVRTASASQDQTKTDHLISQLDDYKAHGVNAVTVFYMGSRGANSDPFSADGLSINAAHQARMEQIIQAADARGMVVIVGVFYQNARLNLQNYSAVENAMRTVANSLSEYDNVIINIANEQNSTGYDDTASIVDMNDPQVVINLASVIKQADPNRLVGGGGYDMNRNKIIGASPYVDTLLFDTGGSNHDSGYQHDQYVAAGITKPLVNVEQLGGYTNTFERGVFDASLRKLYTDEVDRAAARPGLNVFFHNGPWMQVEPMRYDLAGQGTAADPGIRWYFDYVLSKQ